MGSRISWPPQTGKASDKGTHNPTQSQKVGGLTNPKKPKEPPTSDLTFCYYITFLHGHIMLMSYSTYIGLTFVYEQMIKEAKDKIKFSFANLYN